MNQPFGNAAFPKAGNKLQGLDSPLKVEKTLRINKPASELYRFWHNFENLPRFMKHLKSVQVHNDKRSHWITSGSLGGSVEWDADIVEGRENELIAWTSVEGADVDNSGKVRFQPAPGNRGTEVKVVTEYNPPGGVIGSALGVAPPQASLNSLAKNQNSKSEMICALNYDY